MTEQSRRQALTEVVEAEGHLIDSHIMEQIFDTVVEYDGRFEVEHFHIGKTNADPSRLRLKVEAPAASKLDQMLAQLLMLGCAPVEGGDARWAAIERDRCAPEDFYSTTNHRTMVRRLGAWHECRNQRMDALIAWRDGQPVCVRLRDIHTGGVGPLSSLIRNGWVNGLLAGNALGVHDIENALLGTSLGVSLADGRQQEHGHRNHMRAINAIYHAGSIRDAVDQGALKRGIMFECVSNNVPFVLAGSLRDDGPLPDTITDMNAAQDAYAEVIRGAGLVLMLGSMLHSIATGNMLPSWVKTVCVDINPAVATKLGDRGSAQAHGIVTDVGMFLDLLDKALTKGA